MLGRHLCKKNILTHEFWNYLDKIRESNLQRISFEKRWFHGILLKAFDSWSRCWIIKKKWITKKCSVKMLYIQVNENMISRKLWRLILKCTWTRYVFSLGFKCIIICMRNFLHGFCLHRYFNSPLMVSFIY